MPISTGVRAILGVFGPMLNAAYQFGRGAANMWGAYTSAYERLGAERPPATLQDMNQFVGGLGAILRTSQALMAAPDAAALTSEHYAPPIGYEPSGADFAVPSMLVTFESRIQGEEGVVTRWSSLSYNTLFPSTVGSLRDDAIATSQAQLDQQAMEDGEASPTAGGTVVGLGNMYILARGL